MIVAARSQDTFVRAEGKWRFAVRRMHVDLQGDLGRHLLIELPRSPRGTERD